MVTIFPPDWSAKRVPAFDVNIQSANSSAVHMMPKHQTSAISYCLIVRYGLDASVISCPAWRRCFDVHIISCKKGLKSVSQNRKERLSSSAWLLKQRQHQGRTGAREGWRDFTVFFYVTVWKSNWTWSYFSYPFDEDSNLKKNWKRNFVKMLSVNEENFSYWSFRLRSFSVFLS